ncbi:MAG: molybdenum cofactor carrier, partial [Burkholderiales bacterium]
MPITIISGGQTGVDRAALDAAIASGLEYGGWCPKGRLAEDGTIPFCYQLRETSSTAYRTRTSRNVRDSDGTLVLLRDRLRGGTRYTIRYAEKIGRPVLIVRLSGLQDQDIESIIKWLQEHA